jgi:hypothetical protein
MPDVRIYNINNKEIQVDLQDATLLQKMTAHRGLVNVWVAFGFVKGSLDDYELHFEHKEGTYDMIRDWPVCVSVQKHPDRTKLPFFQTDFYTKK